MQSNSYSILKLYWLKEKILIHKAYNNKAFPLTVEVLFRHGWQPVLLLLLLVAAVVSKPRITGQNNIHFKI